MGYNAPGRSRKAHNPWQGVSKLGAAGAAVHQCIRTVMSCKLSLHLLSCIISSTRFGDRCTGTQQSWLPVKLLQRQCD